MRRQERFVNTNIIKLDGSGRYKKQYLKFDALRKFSSGFGWDSQTKRFTAPGEVWDDYFRSHPSHQSLKTKTIDGWDMLEVVVGKLNSFGDSMAVISVAGSDYASPRPRRVDQTTGVGTEDGEDDMLDFDADDNVIDRTSEATTCSQRKCPREDGSTSRDVPGIDEAETDFSGLTNRISELSFTFHVIRDIMEEAKMAMARERAEKTMEMEEKVKERAEKANERVIQPPSCFSKEHCGEDIWYIQISFHNI